MRLLKPNFAHTETVRIEIERVRDSWSETTAIMKPNFAHTETVGIKIERVLRQLGRNYSDNEALHILRQLGSVSEISPLLQGKSLLVTFRSPSVSKRQLTLQVTCAY